MTPTIWVALIAAASSIVTGILALMARKKVQEIHVLVNSRLTEEIVGRARAEARVAVLEHQLQRGTDE